MIGVLLAIAAFGWFMAIAESKRYRAERDERTHDREVYEGEIMALRQEIFTSKIRENLQRPRIQEGSTVIPTDAWIARDNGGLH